MTTRYVIIWTKYIFPAESRCRNEKFQMAYELKRKKISMCIVRWIDGKKEWKKEYK